MLGHETEGPKGPSREDHEFAQLIRAHANRELTGVEEDRLAELGAGHPSRAEEARQVGAVHGLLDQERQLSELVAAPVEPREEADEGFQRLQGRAAEAERSLRARLLHAVRPLQAAVRRTGFRGAPWTLASVAAALMVGLLVFRGGGEPPALLPQTPGPETLGGPIQRDLISQVSLISLTAEIDADNRTISWLPVSGARPYAVVVEDRSGNLVLQRAGEDARSNRWDLTGAQFQILQQQGGDPLLLRVVALDGAGITVGTTGDLPLAIR